MASRLVFARPDKNIINSILASLGEPTDIVRCSVCGKKITDHNDIGAIYPYKSALVCCKKIDCILACSDKLIADDFIHK